MSHVHVAATNRSIVDGFVMFCADAGLAPLATEPAVPREDRTILLTNSAVVSFKPYLLGRTQLAPGGAYVHQPCIRVHNLKTTFSDGFNGDFVLQFEMLGALMPADRPDAFIEQALAYLTGPGGLQIEDLVCKLSSAHHDLADLWETATGDASGGLVRDTEPGPYYDWTFGDPGLTGRGATIAVAQGGSRPPRDLGNLIAFERDGQLVGWGLGFGVETLHACRTRARWVLDTSPAGAVRPIETVDEAKLADLVGLLEALLLAGIEPSNRKQGYVLAKAFAQTMTLADRLGVERADVAERVRDLAQLHGAVDHVVARLRELLDDETGDTGTTAFDLSFLCPVEHDQAVLLDAVGRSARDIAGGVDDAFVIDTYDGPQLPPGTRSVTVRVLLPCTDELPDPKIRVRALVGTIEASDGFTLRGTLR